MDLPGESALRQCALMPTARQPSFPTHHIMVYFGHHRLATRPPLCLRPQHDSLLPSAHTTAGSTPASTAVRRAVAPSAARATHALPAALCILLAAVAIRR